jgi:poly-gamma-glutamate capsule biosynthesis protein CapA/YwtB (metallophosphatase superfamily)
MTELPYTARDVFTLTGPEAELFHGTIADRARSGAWTYPIPASGDYATMTRDDMIYWLYKAQYPVVHAVRGSGLEDFFREQTTAPALPVGFEASGHLSLAAAGDLMDHPYLAASGDGLYRDVAGLLLDADVVTANLECVITNDRRTFDIKTSEAPPLTYREGSFDVLKGHGARRYSFVSTACNHSLDCGEGGVESTLAALDAAGIAHHGVHRSLAESRKATVLDRNGIRLAMISHTFGLNGKQPPPGKRWIVNRTHLNGAPGEVDLSLLEAQIADARAAQADLIVGHLHWGLEHEYYPRPTQLDLAHHLAEVGLDVIIGHHPHVLQPVEHYRTRRDPDRVVPIYYSLGNLVNPFSHPAFRLGGIARLELVKGTTANGQRQTYVASAHRAEVFQEIDTDTQTLRLVPATDEHRSTLP